ncbi:MAG: hypothetical protein AB1644_02520 [Candidatus Zixiibacteriota bacterium]
MPELLPDTPEQIPFSQEVARKATHMGALVIPVGYYLLGLEKVEALAILVPVFLAVVLIDVARLRRWPLWRTFVGRVFSAMIRQHEQNGDFMGATYILLASCCTVALYPKPIAIAALAFIIVGDSFAAVIGRRYGTHRFRNKSIEGSSACLVGTVFVALIAPDLALPVGMAGAAAATLFEAFPLGVDDNVTVPLLSGLTMSVVQKMLVGG